MVWRYVTLAEIAYPHTSTSHILRDICQRKFSSNTLWLNSFFIYMVATHLQVPNLHSHVPSLTYYFRPSDLLSKILIQVEGHFHTLGRRIFNSSGYAGPVMISGDRIVKFGMALVMAEAFVPHNRNTTIPRRPKLYLLWTSSIRRDSIMLNFTAQRISSWNCWAIQRLYRKAAKILCLATIALISNDERV